MPTMLTEFAPVRSTREFREVNFTMLRTLPYFLIAAAVAANGPTPAAAAPAGMIELKLSDRTLEGALAWDRQEVRLLGRDGKL